MDNQIKTIIGALEAKKGFDILCLDLRGHSDLCDFKIICSGDNEKQTRALSDGVEAHLAKHFRKKPSAVEGKTSGFWILLDYGSLMVHIFKKEYRSFYAIEQLWPGREIKSPR